MAAQYDVYLGRIKFVAIEGDVIQSVGESLQTAGAAVTQGDRRPKEFSITLPLHGDDGDLDPVAVAERTRRQVRSMMNNSILKAQGTYFVWTPDPDLNAWLMIGGGEITDPEPGTGLIFGDWSLSLSECYAIATKRSHRPAARMVAMDKRLPTTPRDFRREYYSDGFNGEAAVIEGFVPFATDVINGERAPVDQTRTGWNRNLDNGEVFSYMLPNDAPLANMSQEVVVFDRRGFKSPSQSIAGDRDPQTAYGWEEMYGQDWPMFPTTPIDMPALQNGLCRVTLEAQSNALVLPQYWAYDSVANIYVSQGTIAPCFDDLSTAPTSHIVVCAGIVSAKLIEYGPWRAVVKLVYVDTTSDGPTRTEMYITLQAGWSGPQVDIYSAGASQSGFRYVPKGAGTAGVWSDSNGPRTTSHSYSDEPNWVSFTPTVLTDRQINFSLAIDGTGFSHPTDALVYGANRQATQFYAGTNQARGCMSVKLDHDVRGATGNADDRASAFLYDTRSVFELVAYR